MTGFPLRRRRSRCDDVCAEHRALDRARALRTGRDPDHRSRDSITGSPGCWRGLRCHDLQRAGCASIALASALPPEGCELPDVVMMHLGNTCAVTCTATAGGVSLTVSGHS